MAFSSGKIYTDSKDILPPFSGYFWKIWGNTSKKKAVL